MALFRLAGPSGGSSEPRWEQCRAVVREHGRTFYFASHFLPPGRRDAISAAYAYCRIADDIVDRAPRTGMAAAAASLDRWEREIDAPIHPVAVAFAVARERYTIPCHAARDLIAGVRMDLDPGRYPTWDDLRLYCYRVAGTVGLMAAPVFGCRDDGALAQAVDLGIAMQLTNILRDVGEDARAGRLYLPLDDLAAFGCSPERILAGSPDGAFVDLMRFEIARARALYANGLRGVSALIPAGQVTTLAAAHLYAKILTRIEEQQYDVFSRRAYVSHQRKLREMPAVAAAFASLHMPDALLPRDYRG